MFAGKWKLINSWVDLDKVVRDFDITLEVLQQLVKDCHIDSIATDEGPKVLLADIEDQFSRRR